MAKTEKRQNCFLRLTPENKKYIEEKAKAAGISLNALMNSQIAKEREKKK